MRELHLQVKPSQTKLSEPSRVESSRVESSQVVQGEVSKGPVMMSRLTADEVHRLMPDSHGTDLRTTRDG